MDGMQNLIGNLDRLAREAPAALEQTLTDFALDVQGRAQMKAPVDTGHLRESASTEIERGNGHVSATVGFSATTPGGDYSYALIQHERLDFRHPKGGEAKYLEKALDEVAGDFDARMSEGVNRFLR